MFFTISGFAVLLAFFQSCKANGLAVDFLGGFARLQDQKCSGDAPVSCSDKFNTSDYACCPMYTECNTDDRGQFYCCSSSEDCFKHLRNVPQCSNRTWILMTHEDSQPDKYWCCDWDHMGVIKSEPTEGSHGHFGCKPIKRKARDCKSSVSKEKNSRLLPRYWPWSYGRETRCPNYYKTDHKIPYHMDRKRSISDLWDKTEVVEDELTGERWRISHEVAR